MSAAELVFGSLGAGFGLLLGWISDLVSGLRALFLLEFG